MKATVIAIIAAAVLISGALIFSGTRLGQATDDTPANNVSVVDGQQIIEIRARGGYQPRTSFAQAGLPTILRFNTKGTFDCSSAVRLPSLNISKNLPQSGTTDIPIGTPLASTLQGTCGMGMYPFTVEFRGV